MTAHALDNAGEHANRRRAAQLGHGVSLELLPGMDCRIEVVQRPDGWTVLLAGRLMASQVHELWGACAAIGHDVRVDLTDLLSADPVGVDALRRLRRNGAELVGAPTYFRQWLE